MKNLLLVLFLFPACYAHAQVNYQPITLSEALARSNKEGKMILVQYESADCNQCNEVADKGLNDPQVSSSINKIFIPIKISSTHPDRTSISTLFNIKSFGTLFINQSSTLVHAFLQSSTLPTDYQKQINLAIDKAGEALKVSELEKEYKNGNKSPGFMELLLMKKKSLNLPTDNLLEEYVALLPADSLQSGRVLKFIVNMAPIISSTAHHVLLRDKALFTRTWNSMDLQTRININNRVTYKSNQKAITAKDENLAKRVAQFSQGSYSNPTAGAKAYDKNMLHFYEGIGDTTQYFMKAIAFYERYYMSINADSIKRIDSKTIDGLERTAKRDTVRNSTGFTITSSTQHRPIAQYYTWELKEAATKFYNKTENPHLLSIAANWASRGAQFYKTPEVLEIHSRILYKIEKKQQAVKILDEAIALKKELGFPVQSLENVRIKMKSGSKLD
jgi:hypothetical protein